MEIQMLPTELLKYTQKRPSNLEVHWLSARPVTRKPRWRWWWLLQAYSRQQLQATLTSYQLDMTTTPWLLTTGSGVLILWKQRNVDHTNLLFKWLHDQLVIFTRPWIIEALQLGVKQQFQFIIFSATGRIISLTVTVHRLCRLFPRCCHCETNNSFTHLQNPVKSRHAAFSKTMSITLFFPSDVFSYTIKTYIHLS